MDIGIGQLTIIRGVSPATAATLACSARGAGSWRAAAGIGSTAVADAVARRASRDVDWIAHGDDTVTFSYAALGDAKFDGLVDTLDGASWLSSGRFDTGAQATCFEGDFTMHDVCAILDVSAMLATIFFDAGSYLPQALSAGVAVPEPTTRLLLATVVAVLVPLGCQCRPPPGDRLA